MSGQHSTCRKTRIHELAVVVSTMSDVESWLLSWVVLVVFESGGLQKAFRLSAQLMILTGRGSSLGLHHRGLSSLWSSGGIFFGTGGIYFNPNDDENRGRGRPARVFLGLASSERISKLSSNTTMSDGSVTSFFINASAKRAGIWRRELRERNDVLGLA